MVKDKLRPLFSIVITTYNIEHYVAECIQSIRCQSERNFECIVVDDGSTDGTVEVIWSNIADDARFRLTQITHGGPSAAKNAGLKEAKGEYILFPDGDDTLNPDCLSCLAAKADGYDMLVFGIRYLEYKDGVMTGQKSTVLKEMEFASGSELADWYLVNRRLLLYSAANKCYKRTALKDADIRFRDDLQFGEDRMFNFDFLPFCGKILTLDKVFYNYRHINTASLTTVFRPHYIDDLLKMHKEKLESMLRLARKTNAEEKTAFQKYDICKTVTDAFAHLAEHRCTLSGKRMEEELAYLASVRMPDYFYIGSHYTGENLIAYINRIIFPEKDEITGSYLFDRIIVLGSKACRYRVEYAFDRFGDARYICCGGSISSYKTTDGANMTEADYMREYLLERGVREITSDRKSTNTLENIINASRLIRPEERIAVVTGAFHQKRVKTILNTMELDWKVISVYGPNTQPENWYRNPIGLEAVLKEYEKGL